MTTIEKMPARKRVGHHANAESYVESPHKCKHVLLLCKVQAF